MIPQQPNKAGVAFQLYDDKLPFTKSGAVLSIFVLLNCCYSLLYFITAFDLLSSRLIKVTDKAAPKSNIKGGVHYLLFLFGAVFSILAGCLCLVAMLDKNRVKIILSLVFYILAFVFYIPCAFVGGAFSYATMLLFVETAGLIFVLIAGLGGKLNPKDLYNEVRMNFRQNAMQNQLMYQQNLNFNVNMPNNPALI